MRVLVTGASGFVGRRLMRRLAAAGHDAIGVDREVDVGDFEAIDAALTRSTPEAIVHLAAQSSVARSLREPEACYRVNFVGTRNLLRASARRAPGARILLVGSADQYTATGVDSSPPSGQHAQRRGDTPRTPFDETTPLTPRSPYARSKAAAELLGRRARADGRDIICLRAFNHTGAGQPDTFVVASFARQIARIVGGHEAPRMRVGNLDSVRDFLHVDDVIAAYLSLLVLETPDAVYNVASGRATSIRDVLDRLLALAGPRADGIRVETDRDRWRPTDWLVGDASRLRQATGWRPQIPLDAILREVYEDGSEREARPT